ncbi:24546_t:CDS:1 [Cetraspora pellucida]|uniref:24546_t:CDS:1 n=1 Tax=Cetraspora pellucida TaxID=1433469 RepID=A0A9N8WGF2_9GLOM|nr:24546_t:CDS:1 [Cetraspora pellucida]
MKQYPYTISNLKTLKEKTAIFLLDYFFKIFKSQGKSKLYKKQKYLLYHLVSLDQVVDVKCLPTGFSTSFLPFTNTCDYCYNILNEGEVLTCGHGYHYKCYDKLYYSCNHCKEYYKKGINYNVKMFIKCLEKGLNVLTNEKLQDKEESTPTADDSDDQTELESISEVHNNFVNALEAMSC